jgi:hypothetical protein
MEESSEQRGKGLKIEKCKLNAGIFQSLPPCSLLLLAGNGRRLPTDSRPPTAPKFPAPDCDHAGLSDLHVGNRRHSRGVEARHRGFKNNSERRALTSPSFTILGPTARRASKECVFQELRRRGREPIISNSCSVVRATEGGEGAVDLFGDSGIDKEPVNAE